MGVILFILLLRVQKRKNMTNPSCLNDISNYKQRLQSTQTALNKYQLHTLDSDSLALAQAFNLCFEAGLFNLHQFDSNFQNILKLEFFTALTPCSGSLSFLGIQILAANRIMQAHNFSQLQNYERKRCGIIINHLRASSCVISSIKSEKGYKIKGSLTWASGYKIFDYLVLGFHFEGKELQAIMPFNVQDGISISEPDETFVAMSMNTVHIGLDDYEVLEKDIISTHDIGFYTKQKSISKTIHFALYALGKGAIEVIKDEAFKEEANIRLQAQKQAFMSSNDGEEMDKIRITLFDLVQAIITTGMTLYGGRSILAAQTLQRYYRELILFNSNGLNQELKEGFKSSFLQNY